MLDYLQLLSALQFIRPQEVTKSLVEVIQLLGRDIWAGMKPAVGRQRGLQLLESWEGEGCPLTSKLKLRLGLTFHDAGARGTIALTCHLLSCRMIESSNGAWFKVRGKLLGEFSLFLSVLREVLL